MQGFLRIKQGIQRTFGTLFISLLLFGLFVLRFSDAFNFLIDLPSEDHIWCGSWELMGPLLETFYNYSTDESNDSPLKLLWKRMSVEMRKCTLCISQHHQAQDMYSMEYDSSSISPLLSVLRSLDEERVGQHLKEINARLAGGEYIPERDNAEVVSVMFEVFMSF
ncbi:hypothetical protein CK203_023059 [Vitis vinifera]|uniref:Uncharacterized protein n=1 Tax=Vitis vinifera TaxID=29760 RepID=A0A438J444_VITVI|nr:hypothetical protein CK203_023059 [Vitis vinifera]